MKKSRAVIVLAVLVLLLACFGYTAAVGIGTENSGSASDIKLGLDLAGGVSITYQVVGDEKPDGDDMADTIYKLQKRVESYSTEAIVYQEGDDRINIEIPGVSDANAILEELGKPGSLYFISETDSEGNLNYQATMNADGGISYVMLKGIDEILADGSVKLDGTDVKDAQAGSFTNSMQNTEVGVDLTMTEEGTKKFAEATTQAYQKGESLGIYYDDEIISAPTVRAALTDGKAQITASFTFA